MDSEYIIPNTNEPGKMYLKLRSEFSPSRMEIHAMLVEITGEDVTVVSTSSKGEVSSTTMTLSTEEILLLAEGVNIVQNYWRYLPIPFQHVLLECGCMVPWSKYHQSASAPCKGGRGYCPIHDEFPVYRLNESDFPADYVAPPFVFDEGE